MERRNFVKALAVAGATGLVFGNLSLAQAKCPKGCNCPKCKENNKEKEQVNRLSNKENPSVLEKKHVPLVVAPKEVQKGKWFKVEVKVGFQMEHPSTPDHWIDEIKLLVNGQKVSEIENKSGGTTSPNGCFQIRLDKNATLEAVADCNLHGTWISEPVTVKVA